MRAEAKYVAYPSDCSYGVGLERPRFQSLRGVAKNDVIRFGRREPGDLDRRVRAGSALQNFNLQRIKIPLPFFGVGRLTASRSTRCSSGFKCSTCRHGTRSRPTSLAASKRVSPSMISLFAANKERIAETEETDRGSDLPHMSRIKLAKSFRPAGRSSPSGTVGKLQARERVVTSAMPRGRQRHPFWALPDGCGSSVSTGRRELRGMQSD